MLRTKRPNMDRTTYVAERKFGFYVGFLYIRRGVVWGGEWYGRPGRHRPRGGKINIYIFFALNKFEKKTNKF
jgi:hypothetical protein